ncbi:MAG TPA: monovalent cation/H+ antiporter complex subunit F [Symbiobacteriaceae bacterium]|nr:monovalent cation/H+ antiporter complex subunit F [Symbiobacteriaceae bacterium]
MEHPLWFSYALWVGIGCLAVALVLVAVRAILGPTVADRVVAADALSTLLMSLIIASSIWLDEVSYLDYVLVLAVLSFVGTVAYAKYLQRGVIIERDVD